MAPRKKVVPVQNIERPPEQPDISNEAPAPPIPLNVTRQRSTTARAAPKGSGKDSGSKSGGGGKSLNGGGASSTRVGKKRAKKGMKVNFMSTGEPRRHKPNKKKTTKRGASKKPYSGKR
jgi:hypothetical protein